MPQPRTAASLPGAFLTLPRISSDLPKLSDLGHFLKGSSAALGFVKVKDHCQVIQQYGKKQTLEGAPENDVSVCLARISEALAAAKTNMTVVEAKMNGFYGKT